MSHLVIGLLVAFAIAQIADVATTLRALRRGKREANPLMAWSMRHLGRHGWIAVKLIAAGAIAWVLADGGHAVALAVATALSSGIAIWNVRV